MENMDDEIKHLIQYRLKREFYFLFIDWPDNPVPEFTWMDQNGDLIDMDSMGLDYLKRASKTVESTLNRFLKGIRPPDEVVKAIEPLARIKLQELNEAYRKQV